MAFRRAYSNYANARLWGDDLSLLNSDKLGSAAFTRYDPSNTGRVRQPYRSNELNNEAPRSRKEVRETWKMKVARKKHKGRRTDMRSQEDALALLESGGLNSTGPVRSVQSKASFEDSDASPSHFAKNGVRRIEDWRSKPFDPVSRHLDLDYLKDDILVPGEEFLDHVSGGNSASQQIANAVEPRPEPPRESGERSETRSVENLKKLVRDAKAKLGERSGIEAAEDLIKMVKHELAKQEKSEQAKPKQEESRQDQPQNPHDAEEQALLREVWQHGAEKAPLPKHLEAMRRKYKMDSLAYRAYWRYVAGSMMTPRIPDAYDKARNFLRRLEKARGNKHVILNEEGQKNLSLHLRLMLEAKKLKRMYEEGEEDGREEEHRLTIDDNSTAIAAETEGGPADVRKVKDADLEALVMAVPKVGEQLDAVGRGDDEKMAAVPEQEQKMTVEIQKKRGTIIEERTLRLAKKQAGIANAIRELERNRKIRAISERQADVRIKIQNLLEKIAVEEEKQREAEEAREYAHRLARRQEKRREGLDHVLDDALTRVRLRKDVSNVISARNEVHPPALLSNLHLGAAHRSSTQRTSPKDKAKQERHDGLGPLSTTQAASEHVSEDAPSSIQASPGDIVIDPALTLKLNADTKTLQRQIRQLEGRLSASYPRMDAMPYVISQSENRNTLQTWLRILAKRLKSRDDNVDEWSEEKTEVKAVLDQMVRDHDLDNEAARRMTKRWEDIVQKRAGVFDDVDDGEGIEMFEVNVAEEVSLAAKNEELDVETMKSAEQSVPDTEADEELDMDEFDAGGMSFLNADEKEVYKDLIGSGVSAEDDEVPAAAQNTELDVETAENVEKATRRSNTRSTARRARAATNPLVTSSRKGKNVDEFDAECMSFMNAEEAEVHKELTGSGWFAEDEGDVETAENVEKAAERSNTRSAAPRARAATNPLFTPSRKGKNLVKESAAKRLYSTSSRPPLDPSPAPSIPSTSAAKSPTPSLPHLTSSGSAHMVSVSSKAHTIRTAIAVGTVHFSNPTPLSLITSASLKKGDVLAVSRVAGIMAAKKCPEIVPLCHPIPLTHVGVELRVLDAAEGRSEDGGGRGMDMGYGAVAIEAKVQCTGPTGVEMEALTAVMGAALSVVDMCKAVDKFQRVQDVRVVLKEGGKSGVWKEEGWRSRVNE